MAANGFVVALLMGGRVLAADAVAIVGDEQGCPTPSQVLLALQSTLPRVYATTTPEALSVQLLDDGAAHLVLAAGAARRFVDPARRCVERARKAALFIALRLAPAGAERSAAPDATDVPPSLAAGPALASTPPASDPADEPLATPPPTRPSVDLHELVRWPSIELEVSGLISAAPNADASLTGGGAVRVFAGGRHVGGFVGIGAMAPVLLSGSVDVRLVRVPVDLGVRGRLLWHHTVLALDLGLSLGAQQTEGADIDGRIREIRFEVGFVSRARVAYYVSRRFAPFVELGVNALFLRYLFTVPGRDNPVGDTPRLWVTLSAGLAVRLK